MPENEIVPPRYFLQYRDQATVTNRRGTRPRNKNEFNLVDTPMVSELVQFIAQHFTYTHRMLCLHGAGHDLQDTVMRAAARLRPLQFNIVTQYKHNDDFTAKFCCVGEWIDGGKYREFLELKE